MAAGKGRHKRYEASPRTIRYRRTSSAKDLQFLIAVAQLVLRLKIERDAPLSEITRQKEWLARCEADLEGVRRGIDRATVLTR